LDPLRVSPEDIQADLLSHFVPDWKALDQKRDRRLSYLRMFLAADLSHHAAMTRLMTTSDWDFAAIHYPALGAITGMFLPFLASRPDWVPEQEFQTYQQVVSSAYVMRDRLLQSLAQLVGKDTGVIVVSACGVSTHLPRRELRASEGELWKSPYGWVVVCGPEFKSNSHLLGATILDLAPTILSWFGLPIGDDMEGRVLTESFAVVQEVTRVKTWETELKHRPETIQSRNSGSSENAAVRLQLEYDWNLARSTLDASRYEDALPLLETLFRSFPERVEFGLALFQCQLTLKQTVPAEQTLEVLLESFPPGIEPLFCRAELFIAQGRRKDARALVEAIQKLKPVDPVGLRRLGMLLWRLRQWPALAELAQAVLLLDPSEPLAWLAQAEAALRLGRFSEAFDSARKAISLNYFLPQAHLIVSRALLNQGKWGEAREAMQVVLHLQPGNRTAAAYWRRSGLDQQQWPAK
jgi:tetratricopeptide (TPR) repeat protein